MELNLKFIKNEKELIGKEIIYCNFIESFDSGYNVIATRDNCIRILEQEADWDYLSFNNPIVNKEEFDKILINKNNKNFVKELIKYNVISQEYYDFLIKEENKRKQIEINNKNKVKLLKEYKEYLRLKAKFEKEDKII